MTSTFHDTRPTLLRLRPIAAALSALLLVSTEAFAQAVTCSTSGPAITIDADCTGDITTANTLTIEASEPSTKITGNVTGAGTGTFATNTLNLNVTDSNPSAFSSDPTHEITGTVSNFGTINLNYSLPEEYDSSQGFANIIDQEYVASDPYTIDMNIDTGANAGASVKLNIFSPLNPDDPAHRLPFMGIQFDGDITGSGGLEVNLPNTNPIDSIFNNTLILAGNSNSNTYTGLTTVKSGTLQIGNSDNFSFAATNNVRLEGEHSVLRFYIPSNGEFTYTGAISSDGHGNGIAFDKDGDGTLILTTNQTYTGGTEISGGILQIGNGGAAGMIGYGDLNISWRNLVDYDIEAATVIINRSDDFTWDRGSIGSADLESWGIEAMLIKQGSNTVILPEASLAGLTQVKSGTLQLGDGRSITTSPASGNIEIESGAMLIFNFSSNAPILREEPDKDISGAGALVKAGSGTLILMNDNDDYTGAVTINGGTLQLGGDPNGTATATGSIANTSGVTIASGATLAFNHTSEANSDVTTPTYAISGDGNLLKQGSGTLTLNSDSNATFTGKTIVTGGKLVISYTAPAPQMIGPLAEITVGDTYASTALDLTGGVEVEDQVTNGHRWEEITLAGINTYTGKLNAENAEINVVIQSGGPTRLDVTGDADITNSKVNVVVADNASFSMGNTYNFLSSQGTNGIIGNFSNNTISASQGRMVNYIFAVQPDGNLRLIGAAPREEMKSLSEGYLAGPAALSHAGDFLASHGIAAARAQLARAYGVTDDGQEIPELGLGGSGLQPFLSHSGGRLRYNTGSHVTSQGYNFLAGVVAGFRAPRGEALAGAFFEYGRGNYDTYNAFAAGDVTGDGDVHHRGLGLFARVGLENGLYVDGSIRRGKVDTTYQSDTLSLAGTRMAFSSKADYTGAHVGVGKLWPLPNLSEKLSLDTYGQAFWTRQDGSDVTLSTGLKVTFDRVDSRRLKAGAKLRYDFTPQTAGYAGIAYDHEFDGKAKARLTDFGGELPVPKMTGGTGVVELGFLITPTASTPVSVDFGIQGHAGKREGLTGNLRLNYYF